MSVGNHTTWTLILDGVDCIKVSYIYSRLWNRRPIDIRHRVGNSCRAGEKIKKLINLGPLIRSEGLEKIQNQ